ncbi:MAG TPA: hypothetical protein VNU94_05070 [Acidobacteriaceae bacterium]|nr:hypothetical protein [Acidobacteriaceae bacterium]
MKIVPRIAPFGAFVAMLLAGCGGSSFATGLVSLGSVVPSATLTPNSIAVSGDYAYVALQGSAGAIAVLDISTGAPALLTTFPMPCTQPNGIKVSGGYAYVTCYDTGALYVLSINNADPAAPVLAVVGSVSGLQSPYPGTSLSGTHLYVPSHAGFIFRVDVSNPAAPVIDGSVATAAGTSPNAVYVANSIVYCACSSEPMQSWFQTFTATGTMTLLGQIPLTHSPQRVVVSGNYAYVTNFDSMKLDIVDVTNPAAPSVLTSVALPCNALPVAVTASYAYVGCYSAQGIATINITNPANATVLRYTATSASPVQDLALSGTSLYAVSGNAGGSFNTLANAF